MRRPFQITLSGDSAVNLCFGSKISPETSALVRTAAARLAEPPIPGVQDIVPTYCSIMVCYDPTVLQYEYIIRTVQDRLRDLDAASNTKGKTVYIPVCYGGEHGPDLEYVAEYHNMTVEEVIELHTEPSYLISMLGFLPGFAYLGGLDERLHTPRLETPRIRLDAGAVGIGGAQTGIYPLPSPGGWQILGNTPARPYDPYREPAFLYAAGDYIKFYPISEEEYAEIKAAVEAGTYQYRIEEEQE